MNSTNPADYTDEQLRDEVERGARIVMFPYCVSLLVITFRRNSRPYVIPAGQGAFNLSLRWALVSFLFGWWGIPWGIIYTPVALWQTLGGGVDLTDEWRNNYDEALRAEKASRLAALRQQQQPPVSDARTSSPAPESFRPDSSAPASFRDDDLRNPGGARPSRFTAASKTILAIGAVVLVAYLGIGYMAMRGTRTVTLINGLGENYQVTLNGTPYDCPADTKKGGPVKHIQLPPGRYEVRATLPRDLKFQATADIGPASIWSWPGRTNRVVMINADGLAIVYREKITYTARPDSTSKNAGKEPNPVELFVNQGIIDIRKPDYYFKGAPKTLRIKKNAGSTRTQVGILRDLTVPQAIGTVHKYRTPGEAATYAARATLFHGNAAMNTLLAIVDQMAPEDARKMLVQQLDTRPVNVQWHRYYQNYAEIKFPGTDLVADYRARLATDPQNGALAYLLARVLPDRAEARALYEKAIAAPEEPCIQACNGLAYEALRDGDYAGALEWFEKAAGDDPQSSRIEERLSLLAALNRADDALALAKGWFRKNPSDLALAANAMLFIGVCKRPAVEATHTILAYTNASAKKMPKAELENCRIYLAAAHAYGSGNEKRYAEHLSKLVGEKSWGHFAFNRALALGDHAAAADQLDSAKYPRAESWFLTAIEAHMRDDRASADAYYAKGIAVLRDSGRDSRALAGILEAAPGSTPDIAAVREHAAAPDDARVIFCLLGFRHPSQRDTFWREARAANFAPGFPHLLLKRVMSE